VHYNGRSVKLSRRESQLIAALLTQNGKPMRVRELLHRAWAGNHLSEAQMRSYVVLLRKKLALLEVPGALVNEPGVGYSLRFDPEIGDDQPRLSVVQSNRA
jgi:DNA-binding response OmpR family regulator